MNIRKSESSSLKFKSKFFVINTHKVHKSCLKVMNMDWIFKNIIPKRVGRKITHALVISIAPLNIVPTW